MGVGKSFQAIALAACHAEEWTPLLIICPASIRLLWAEELEKWLPSLAPSSVSLIQARADWRPHDTAATPAATAAGPDAAPADPSAASTSAGGVAGEGGAESGGAAAAAPAPQRPRILISSYQMLRNLSCKACSSPHCPVSVHNTREVKDPTKCPGFPSCMAAGKFGFVIVDESHHMRSLNAKHDSGLAEAAAAVVRNATHAVLLSGTPSVTRPFDLFGQLNALQQRMLPDKKNFAFRYCQRRSIPGRWCAACGRRRRSAGGWLTHARAQEGPAALEQQRRRAPARALALCAQ